MTIVNEKERDDLNFYRGNIQKVTLNTKKKPMNLQKLTFIIIYTIDTQRTG